MLEAADLQAVGRKQENEPGACAEQLPPAKRRRTSPREIVLPAAETSHDRSPRQLRIFPFDDSNISPPASPLLSLSEANMKVKWLEAKMRTLEMDARFHEMSSKRWKLFCERLMEERIELEKRQIDSGLIEKLQRRGDRYKEAYVKKKEQASHSAVLTRFGLENLQCLHRAIPGLPLKPIVKLFKLALVYDEDEDS